MSDVFTCGPGGDGHNHGKAPVLRRAGKSRVIDLHCHMAVAAADALAMPNLKGPPSFAQFSSPASAAVNRELFADIGPKLNGVDARLADMDRLGIDVQVMSPSPGQYYYELDGDVGLQVSRLINDSIAEGVAKHPDRLLGMGTVPFQAPEQAVAEMRRCVRDLGFRGIEISSNVAGRELADDEFRPFFAAAEELGVLVFLHPLGFTHGQRLSEHYFNNLIGNPLESALAVGHLIFGGVLDAYPGLKLCVAHGGGYLPTYWGRMDHGWRVRADCRQHIDKPPSDYLRQLYFDTLVFDKAHLRFLVETYGADHLALGTDYPFDMSEPDPIGFHDQLSDADRDMILGGTAERLLGLNTSDA